MIKSDASALQGLDKGNIQVEKENRGIRLYTGVILNA